MGAASYRPTWQQALGRGLFFGALATVLALAAAVPAVIIADPPPDVWLPVVPLAALLAFACGLLIGRWSGTDVSARGIRTATREVAPWSRVVDLRAERRGARTVVSVYLDSGASMQLAAPYSGEFFAADPRFDMKVHTLSDMWRSHRV